MSVWDMQGCLLDLCMGRIHASKEKVAKLTLPGLVGEDFWRKLPQWPLPDEAADGWEDGRHHRHCSHGGAAGEARHTGQQRRNCNEQLMTAALLLQVSMNSCQLSTAIILLEEQQRWEQQQGRALAV